MSVISGRSRVATKYGIVAASQPLAARAGVQVLERGGNAVDAAIATNAVMGLVEPQSNGIGGDLFAIVYDAKTGELHGLNASGWAPGGLTPAFMRQHGFQQMPETGIHTVTVPGAVAGWEALRARLGTLPMSDLLAPAIFYADEGFPVSDVIAAAWASLEERLAAEPGAARTYLPGGRPPAAGGIFRNRDLAESLRLIAADGPAGFYEGKTAEAILAISGEHGGTMAAADLREIEVEWVAPISTTYRGWTVHELPPNTQGIAALAMLDLMEPFPLGEYGFHSAAALHVMIEAKKLAYADMLRYVGDTRFGSAPVSAILDKEHAKARARKIDSSRAASDVEPSVLEGVTNSLGADTIYLSVIDRHGNIVSLIQSIYVGFGSAIVPPGAGFALHNRGALFTLEEAHPNTLAPRKRPLHTIIPGFMQNGDTRIGFGIMGGFNQAQAHAQFVANIVDYGMDIQQALEAGRFTKGTFAGVDVNIETLVPEPVRTALAALGHDVTSVPPRTGTFGHGQAVMSDASGVHFGASEPRHDGAAIPEAPPVFGNARPT
ncbi:MAG TPA: gamma-glutamyltransferase [Vicinamibacterales bacterium]|jgi:gamma-glutamyltranspeptidase/glutathione hydrolase|nr:gamma-glutamyltransferase [Vicinamibacterales bacterium]